MMNRLKMLLGSLLLCLGMTGALLVATTSPAQAGEGWWQTSRECVQYDGGDVKTCLILGWKEQQDGTGVVLERIHLETPMGCGLLKYPPYLNFKALWFDPGTDRIWGSNNWGDENQCNFTKDGISWGGADEGPMVAQVTFVADPCCGRTNNYLTFKATLRVNGNYEWTVSQHTD